MCKHRNCRRPRFVAGLCGLHTLGCLPGRIRALRRPRARGELQAARPTLRAAIP